MLIKKGECFFDTVSERLYYLTKDGDVLRIIDTKSNKVKEIKLPDKLKEVNLIW